MRKLFPITFPVDFPESQTLYFKKSGDAFGQDETLNISKDSKISFDTFFNCFSYSKYKKHTGINECALLLSIKGCGIMRVYQKVIVGNKDDIKNRALSSQNSVVDKYPYEEILLVEKEFENKEKDDIVINLSLDNLDGDGFLFFEIETKEDTILYGGEFCTNEVPKNNIKIGIVICTYKREKYVLNNLQRIQNFLSENQEYKDKFEVFVVDNGKTLGEESPVSCAKIYPNRNLGGSGGFTRGIMEVKNREEFTHFLLMDDDIVFQQSILQKLYHLLEHAKDQQNLCIGGAMLRMDCPQEQYEFGACWNGNGYDFYNRKRDLSNSISVLQNEIDFRPDYNAWWFSCMPISAINKGLPMPFFIKVDDVEYGLRFGGENIVINGIGVWHQDFDKKYNGVLEYYGKRNECVKNAIHNPKLNSLFYCKKAMRAVGLQLVYQRYDVARLIILAYQDFLRGPDFFKTDAIELHARLQQMVTKQKSGRELIDEGYDLDRGLFNNVGGNTLKHVLTLNGYLIPNCFYNKEDRKKGRLVSLSRPNPKSFYKSSLTIQYDAEAEVGIVTKQSRVELIKISLKLACVCVKLALRGNFARKEYRKRIDELTSIETWKKLLTL